LDGKVVIVTGGGRGIGRGIARGIASSGGRVVVADSGVTLRGADAKAEVASEVVDDIVASGGDAVAFTGDMATMSGAQGAIDTALGHWSRLDGAVCCAGILRHGPFQDLTEEDFDAVVRTHLKGHFVMLQSAFKLFLERGHPGSLIAISSGYLLGDPLRSSYRAAKAGVVALMKSVALAGNPHGIRANAIAPLANTRMTAASQLQFDSDPDDIAPVAVFLLSDESTGINGEVFDVNGNTIGTWADPRQSRTVRHWKRWDHGDIVSVMPWLLAKDAMPVNPPLPGVPQPGG
jgi:NAD(P)-dependent dehydrogenase (short-subunit alcohol dehydrogenase family)